MNEQAALTPAEYERLRRWRAIYMLGTVLGTPAARRIVFLRWLVQTGRLEG